MNQPMRVPKRRSEERKIRDDRETVYLTATGIQRLKNKIELLEKEKPEAINEVSRLAQLGDFSENEEYREAKVRLRRIHARLFSLRDQLKRSKLIEADGKSHLIHLGSTVIVQTAGKNKTYQIVGPEETNPSAGRISYLSPLGAALMNHTLGEEIQIGNESKKTIYKIERII